MGQYRIGHIEVESPWGNAGGVVKTLEDAELMAHTGVGFIEAGSYTLEARAGNAWNDETQQYDRTVYFHDPIEGKTFNSLGMPNKGMDVVEKEIPEMVEVAHSYGKPLIVNVAPVTDDPVHESQELVRRAFEAGAPAVLLNAGCPNVVTSDGGRHDILSHSPESLRLVLNGLAEAVEKHSRRIFVRLSPVESEEAARQIAHVIRLSGVVGAVYTPNTWPGQRPIDDSGKNILDVPGGMGGGSGPYTAAAAHQQTLWALKALECSGIDVVSSGGIVNGQELARRLTAGAAAGAGTTLYYESAEEGWSEATDRLLRQHLEV